MYFFSKKIRRNKILQKKRDTFLPNILVFMVIQSQFHHEILLVHRKNIQ